MANRTFSRSKKSPFRRLWTLLLFVGLLILLRFVQPIGPDLGLDERFRVHRVIDGDTVELTKGEKLRLLYLDTPERGEPCYDSAKNLVDSVAVGRIGVVEFGRRQRDDYGRLLGELRIDTLSVQELLLRRGYANLYLFEDNDRPEKSPVIRRLLLAQNEALTRRAGIWSVIKTPETNYLASRRSFRFHRPSCRSMEDAVSNGAKSPERFSDRYEALRKGLSPCRNCKP